MENAPTEDNKKTKAVPTDQSIQVEWLKYISGTVLVVLFLAFITLLFNYYQQSAVSFEGLKDQIIIQNSRIEFLTTQLQIYSKGKIK